MKAIVTGGAGFIGSHLARRLLKEGWDVLVVDNLSSGHRRNIPDGAEFIEMDLTDEASVKELPAGGIDAVFHLASHVGQELSFAKPLVDFKANGFATMLLLQWCMNHNIKKFIFASSMNVYGSQDIECVDEQNPVRPPSPYAVGKISSEYLCQIYQNLGMETTSLRLFNIYGPGQDLDNMLQGMVSIFLSFVVRGEPVHVRGSKDRFRDFVYVDDAVDAFYRCLDSKASGKVYNVATGRKTFIWQLVEEIVKAFKHDPKTYPITFGESTIQDQFGIYGNADLIKQELGWNPMVGLTDGLKEMAAWASVFVDTQKKMQENAV